MFYGFNLAARNSISYFYLLSLQLVLCRVAALRRSPVHHIKRSLYFTYGPLISVEIFLEIVNTIIGFDSYILNRFLLFKPPFSFISVLRLTAYTEGL